MRIMAVNPTRRRGIDGGAPTVDRPRGVWGQAFVGSLRWASIDTERWWGGQYVGDDTNRAMRLDWLRRTVETSVGLAAFPALPPGLNDLAAAPLCISIDATTLPVYMLPKLLDPTPCIRHASRDFFSR